MKKQLETLKEALLDLDRDIEILEIRQRLEMSSIHSKRLKLQSEIIKLTAQVSTQS